MMKLSENGVRSSIGGRTGDGSFLVSSEAFGHDFGFWKSASLRNSILGFEIRDEQSESVPPSWIDEDSTTKAMAANVRSRRYKNHPVARGKLLIEAKGKRVTE